MFSFKQVLSFTEQGVIEGAVGLGMLVGPIIGASFYDLSGGMLAPFLFAGCLMVPITFSTLAIHTYIRKRHLLTWKPDNRKYSIFFYCTTVTYTELLSTGMMVLGTYQLGVTAISSCVTLYTFKGKL